MEGLWDKILSQVDANDQLSQVDVGIEIEGTGLEVTRCGARLVYEQDIEDLKQNMASSYSCSITSYEDDLDDLAKNTIIKRSHDDHDGDGDGPSGEVTYNEEIGLGIQAHKNKVTLNARKRNPSEIGSFDEFARLIHYFSVTFFGPE
nr:hypothetical protein CFP56_36645 [Quercus suber]